MPKVWLSSTVMTPSLPTFSSASAIIEPISLSAAEMAATLAMAAGSVSTFFDCALDRVDGGDDGGLDALLQDHRVGAGGDVAQALADHRPREHGGGRGAVTGDVVGLLGDFLDELGADLLVRVLEVDLLGDRDTVVRDRGGAPLLLEHDVAALRAEGDADRVGELVHARLERPAGVLVVGDLLRPLRKPPGAAGDAAAWNGRMVGTQDSRVLNHVGTRAPRVQAGNRAATAPPAARDARNLRSWPSCTTRPRSTSRRSSRSRKRASSRCGPASSSASGCRPRRSRRPVGRLVDDGYVELARRPPPQPHHKGRGLRDHDRRAATASPSACSST